MPREAAILKIEQYGSLTCELSPSSSFVLVRVPVRIVGDGATGEGTFHYSIGSFAGRDSTLALRADLHARGPADGPLGQALGGHLARQDPILRADSRLGRKGRNLRSSGAARTFREHSGQNSPLGPVRPHEASQNPSKTSPF